MTRANFNKIIFYTIGITVITYILAVIVSDLERTWKFWLSIVVLASVASILGVFGKYIHGRFESFKNSLPVNGRAAINTTVKTIEVFVLLACGAIHYDIYQTNPVQVYINVAIFVPIVIHGIYRQQQNEINKAQQ